jgi:hypothetical protein
MKKIFLMFAIWCAAMGSIQAQDFGIKLGVSTPSGGLGKFQVVHPDSNFQVALKGAKYGIHGGFWLRAGNRVFIQPEVYFNANKQDYTLEGGVFSQVVKTEKYQYLDMPVLVGLKLGPVHVLGGPVGHYFIKSTSTLTDVAGYEQMFDDFTFSYQLGGGLDLGKVGIDVRYQGRFSNKNGHMNFFGQEYDFDKSPASIVASLRYQLF